MNSKILWISILAAVVSFFGGFYLANSLNGDELLKLRAENEQLKKVAGAAPQNDSDAALSDEEIRQKIAEADQNPGNVSYQRNLGMALLSYGVMKQNAGLIAESARLLKRAHASDPQDFDVAVGLGNAFYDIGSLKNDSESFEKAREYYAKALALKPDDAAVRADFGSTFVFVDQPDYERASKELERALQLAPKNERALLLMAQMLVKQNNATEAEKYLARLREIDPKAPTLGELTAQLAQQTNPVQK
ncbi:MAG TPA: tetratricopeptide repeat protein [Pyrinomonadaceae bacterium]|jgi:tetratricopeptide (TPR) repeat protein